MSLLNAACRKHQIKNSFIDVQHSRHEKYFIFSLKGKLFKWQTGINIFSNLKMLLSLSPVTINFKESNYIILL